MDEDGRVLYVNQPAESMLDRSRDRLLGKRFREEFSEAVEHPFHEAFKEAIRTGLSRRIVERYDPLGRISEARMSQRDDRRVVVARDITVEQQVDVSTSPTTFGLRAVAEETTLDTLRDLGAALTQGLYCGRPEQLG